MVWYDSFCHIFFFLHILSLHLFLSQKSLNDEERGGNCLLVPERSYGPEFQWPWTTLNGRDAPATCTILHARAAHVLSAIAESLVPLFVCYFICTCNGACACLTMISSQCHVTYYVVVLCLTGHLVYTRLVDAKRERVQSQQRRDGCSRLWDGSRASVDATDRWAGRSHGWTAH